MPTQSREIQQMSNDTEQPKKGFWARYKKYILSFLVIWALLLIALVLLTDQKNLPFVYQFG